MGRRVREHRLETREGRLKLPKRQNPYWKLIGTNLHLGYRKGPRGGQWYYRVYHENDYIKRAFAEPDDYADANGKTILNFDQAQDRARKETLKIISGNDNWTDKPYTIQDAINDYLTDFKAHGKKSLYATETQIKAHIVPTFADKAIAFLTYEKLNAWKNKIAISEKRTRTGLASKQRFKTNVNDDPEYQRKRRATANRIITIFKAILNHAFQTNKAQSNEAWIKLKPFKNVSAPKIQFLTEPETIRLLNACEPDFRLLVRGALLTGARYGELTSLKISDYSNKNILIHQSKSGKPRHIPLNEEGIKFFEQLIIGRKSEEYIFSRADGKKWGKNYQTRPLEAACKAAKIEPSISFHILRHTYGSILAMKDVSLQVIATLLGHSDTRITSRHYAHLMPSYISSVVKENLPNFGKTEESTIVTMTNKTVQTA
jgi:integrase